MVANRDLSQYVLENSKHVFFFAENVVYDDETRRADESNGEPFF